MDHVTGPCPEPPNSPPAEKVIEHHWHEPEQSQVTKALYQYLAKMNITTESLMEVCQKKIEQAVTAKINRLLQERRLEEVVVNTVAQIIRNEKAAFDGNTYGFHNRIRDLVQEEIKRLVLANYTVSVTPKS